MKILIIQIGRIGDMVLTTPMFGAIKRRYPDAELHILASSKNYEVIENDPRLGRIFIYRKKFFSILFLLFRLRHQRYDYWIDPKDHRSRESMLLARLCGAKLKIGWNSPDHKVFEIGIPSDHENFTRHAVERNLQALASLDIVPMRDDRPKLFINAEVRKFILGKIKKITAPKAIINISAGNPSRKWPVENWREVCWYCFSAGYSPIINFHPQDETIAKELHAGNPRFTLFYSRSIKDVIGLIEHAQLVISPDTAVIHIASAFNIPTVGLYPRVEWNLYKFKPISDVNKVVLPEGGESLERIHVDAVISKMKLLFVKFKNS